VPGNDTDTDRIIPARFMKCVTFDGLGEYAFYDERYDEKGNQKKHPFNDIKYKNGSILIVNKNFGCGSSREHAPQSLMRFGIRAIIGESFAEIFAGNCATLGIPAVTAPAESIEKIMKAVEEKPDAKIIIDLENKKITVGRAKFEVDMPESTRLDLLKGTWDSTGLLLANLNEIKKTVAKLPYLQWKP
jgi:3-isopropylmalate/(R)-2-methylmalate dehydratase small subunit